MSNLESTMGINDQMAFNFIGGYIWCEAGHMCLFGRGIRCLSAVSFHVAVDVTFLAALFAALSRLESTETMRCVPPVSCLFTRPGLAVSTKK